MSGHAAQCSEFEMTCECDQLDDDRRRLVKERDSLKSANKIMRGALELIATMPACPVKIIEKAINYPRVCAKEALAKVDEAGK